MHQKTEKVWSVFITLLILHCSSSAAGSWETETNLGSTLRYNDNPTLAPKSSEPESTVSNLTSIEMELSLEEQDRSVLIKPKAQAIYYPESEFENLNDFEFFLLANVTGYGPRHQWSVNFDYSDVTLLTASDADPSDPGQSGSGIFLQLDEKQETITFLPEFTWLLSEKDLVSASALLSRVEYEEEFSPRADYDYWLTDIFYQRSVSERQAVGVRASYSYSESESKIKYCFISGGPPEDCRFPGTYRFIVTRVTDQSYEGKNINLTYSFDISSQLSLMAEYGLQNTEIESLGVETALFTPDPNIVRTEGDTDTTTYLFRMNYSGLKTDWEINASRDVQPSSEGNPSDKKQLQASIKYQVRPKLSLQLAGIGYEQKQRSAFETYEVTYMRFDATATRKLTPNLYISGSYIYRNRDPVNITNGRPTTGSSNRRRSDAVNLFVSYKF